MTNIKERIDEYSDIRKNPLKFLKYVKILDQNLGVIDFVIWPHLEEVMGLFTSEKRLIFLKARRLGFSWLAAAYAVWVIYTRPGARVLLTSQGQDEAKELLEKCIFIYDNLPKRFHIFKVFPRGAEAFGLEKTLDGRVHNSRIHALSSTINAGSGYGATLVIADELDKHEFAAQNFQTIKPTLDGGGQYIGIYTVVKKTPDSFAKNLWRDGNDGKNGFTARFYGWRTRKERDDAWYEREEKEYMSLPEKGRSAMEAENPDTWQEALSPMSTTSCFKRDVLDLLWDNRTEPETKQSFIHIFKKWQPGYLYGAGVDVAEGVRLDYSVLTILGRFGLQSEVVALIYSNEIPTNLFTYSIEELCKEYKNPLLFVENNGLGDSVISRLLESNYPKLYYTGKEAGKEGKAGWTSSGGKYGGRKKLAFDTLVNDVNEGNVITRFSPQIQELMEYQYLPNGKFEPTGKTHGDTVISLMLANLALGEKRSGSKVTVTYPRYARPSHTPSLRY